jgi:uncharacterized protein YbjT (DUF2867 family)
MHGSNNDMNIKKTAVVLGASGLVGNDLVKILLQNDTYEKVYLLVRKYIEINHSKCEQHIIDFDKLSNYSNFFKVQDVFCCLGTTIKKAKSKEAFRKVDYGYPVEAAKLAKEKGAEKFLVISAMGASSKSIFFYNQVKGQLEETLCNMELPSLHIFRPSLLLGDRGEFRFGENLAAKMSGILNLILAGPLRQYRAIEAKTVATAMVKAAASNQKGITIYFSNKIEDLGKRV